MDPERKPLLHFLCLIHEDATAIQECFCHNSQLEVITARTWHWSDFTWWMDEFQEQQIIGRLVLFWAMSNLNSKARQTNALSNQKPFYFCKYSSIKMSSLTIHLEFNLLNKPQSNMFSNQASNCTRLLINAAPFIWMNNLNIDIGVSARSEIS